MKATNKTLKSLCSMVLYTIQLTTQVLAGTQFTSHVSVNTPARSFSHGVGDPLSVIEKRHHQHRARAILAENFNGWKSSLTQGRGYPKTRPTIPFTEEEVPRETISQIPWQYNSFMEVSIPVLPPSPYRVDSPDPESLWPEGLYLPSISPPRFGTNFGRRADTGENPSHWTRTY